MAAVAGPSAPTPSGNDRCSSSACREVRVACRRRPTRALTTRAARHPNCLSVAVTPGSLKSAMKGSRAPLRSRSPPSLTSPSCHATSGAAAAFSTSAGRRPVRRVAASVARPAKARRRRIVASTRRPLAPARRRERCVPGFETHCQTATASPERHTRGHPVVLFAPCTMLPRPSPSPEAITRISTRLSLTAAVRRPHNANDSGQVTSPQLVFGSTVPDFRLHGYLAGNGQPGR